MLFEINHTTLANGLLISAWPTTCYDARRGGKRGGKKETEDRNRGEVVDGPVGLLHAYRLGKDPDLRFNEGPTPT
jgi:hypothetical protein